MTDIDRMLPLYEAKMLHHYDHRWATYDYADVRGATLEEKQDPGFVTRPRYWVAENEVDDQLEGLWDKQWLLGWRDICRSTDERTMIDAIIPRTATPDGTLLMLPKSEFWMCLPVILSSFVYDFTARQKVGGTHLKFYTVFQTPVLAPSVMGRPCDWDRSISVQEWIVRRFTELVYSAHDQRIMARELGEKGPPFRWEPERRGMLRAELDAALFHLYGVSREDADYILDTFPIVKRKDEAKYGEYRTKRLIIEVYDRLAEAIVIGEPYRTILDPPAGQGPRHPTEETAR